MKKNNKGGKPLDLTNSIKPPVRQHKKELKAKTPGQQEYIDAIDSCQIIICDGVSGSGKTCCAIGKAVEYLLNNKIERIILTRPFVNAGEDFGALPGDIDDKIAPFLRPLYDELRKYLSYSEITDLKNSKKLDIIPLGFIRGLNFHNCFVVADECQNATLTQLKMLLTRVGSNCKMVITGDRDQSDLAEYSRYDFEFCVDRLIDIPELAVVKLTATDIVRNPLIAKILNRLK